MKLRFVAQLQIVPSLDARRREYLQSVRNLIDDALKATGSGTIEAAVGVLARSPELIQERGIGIETSRRAG